jgi:hypothetical protein
MDDSKGWLKDELLQAFYNVIDDFRNGTIDEETFKERLLSLAERYERGFTDKTSRASQKNLHWGLWLYFFLPMAGHRKRCQMNLHEEISKLAYELYEKGGRLEGRDLDNWLDAQKIVRTRCASEDKNDNEVINWSDMKYVADERKEDARGLW